MELTPQYLLGRFLPGLALLCPRPPCLVDLVPPLADVLALAEVVDVSRALAQLPLRFGYDISNLRIVLYDKKQNRTEWDIFALQINA